MDEIDQALPVPKPRRIAADVTKSQYENVTIDIVNKNITIQTEDIDENINLNIPENKDVSIRDLEKNIESKNISSKEDKIKNEEKNVLLDIARPVPAPRRTLANDQQNDVYENSSARSSLRSLNVSPKDPQVARKAPEIPTKSNSDSMKIHRLRSVSVGDVKNDEFKLKKSVSNSTINSSISSSSSNDNRKYKSPSPSDLLKTLGTTSRLLSEAISERVSIRAKGAKHKIDKNIKSSQNAISNWGTETTTRLKNVRKKMTTLGINNFTLSKHEPSTSHADEDRPKTMPANDEVFHSISFNSPLNKMNNMTDLSRLEPSYEIPKTVKQSYSPCPSYDEALKTSKFTFDQDKNLSKSLRLPSPKLSLPKCSEQKPIQSSNSRSSRDLRKDDFNFSTSDESLPMPKYPPPVLPEEHIYGVVNPIQPPARPKRRKNYEAIQLRRNQNFPHSNRATVDPSEFADADSSSRDVSREIQNIINEHEKLIENPERSESWTYIEGNDEDSSSPEPVYANQEITYGKLCEMKSDNVDIPLTPQLSFPCSSLLVSQSNLKETHIPADILDEFDPLIGKDIHEYMEKSNQLLLLENLLEEDTYGKVTHDSNILDDQSIDSSDEENGNIAAALPIPPLRSDSLQQSTCDLKANNDAAPAIKKHVNLVIDLSKTANVLNEGKSLKNADRIRENNLNQGSSAEPSPTSHSRTNWFLNRSDVSLSKPLNISNINKCAGPDKVAKKHFPKDDKDDQEGPPSYSDAMSSVTNSFVATEAPISPLPEAQSKGAKKSMFSNVLSKMDVLKRKTSFRYTRSNETRIVLEMIPKATLSQRLVRYDGPLIRLPSGAVEDILKEMQNRKAILRERKFQTFQDQEMKNPKESFALEHITTIQCVSNNKITDNATLLYCFEITTATSKNQQTLSNPNVVITSNNSGNCKLQRSCHLYGVGKATERNIWMQKLIECLTSVFPSNYTCQYYRAGWCYLKNSITSQWSGAWILLKKRKRRLVFYTDAGMNLERVDLRKARCIVLKESDESIRNLHVEAGPTIMIDCPPYTIYLIMSCPRETKIWRHIIKEVAHENGMSLNEQQLTKFNVPVLVDKCINFVYIHGCMSEGIYRKSGSENSIQKLISQFRTDAFNVEISRNEYNEHDVANVLKRFMRDLPQRLLGKYSVSFICVTQLKSVSERIESYKDLLGRLSEVEYQTLKRIIGHLEFISSQKSKNKMGIDNLSMIWGPTLLDNTDEDITYSQKEGDVIAQLIALYKHLFPLTADEISKEQGMLQCLQKYYAAAENLSDSIKKSGDLKVWITIDMNPENKIEEKTQVNVTLNPTKTVYEVCKELSQKVNVGVHQLTLHEVILNETLERPLHHNERVFHIALRWSYWPEQDRKNNHLVLRPLEILKEVQRALKNLATVTPGKELKFADRKTKSFKSFQVDLRDGRILVTKKEKNTPVLVREIVLRNVIAYLGCEKKRDSQWGWAITFIEKENNVILRSRDLPYIGHVIGGNIWEDRIIWFSSIWNSMYGDDIMPPPEIIIK